jgi:hypothetical protein
MRKNEFGSKTLGYWIGLILKVVLAAGMLLYLGKHSLNFFMWTFQGQDEIYAWLGLLTTSAGVIIWLLAFKFVARNTWEKAIALIMMLVALVGEFIVAGFDMWLNIAGQMTDLSWTPEDLRAITYIVAGLALLNGLALIADVAGMDIIEGLKGADSVDAPSEKQETVAPNFLSGYLPSRGNGARGYGMNVPNVAGGSLVRIPRRSPARPDAGSDGSEEGKPSK